MFEGSDDKESACNAGKDSEVAQSFLDSATLWTVTYQALLSMGFSRQEYWSGLPCPSPEDLPNRGIKPGSPTLWADALPSEPPAMQELRFNSWVRKIPWRRTWQPTPVF